MADPVIAQKSPYGIELEPGEYSWCACGKSAKQPFCDGSHKGGEFSPKKFTVDKAGKVFLCGCKNTKTSPMCDGTHKSL